MDELVDRVRRALADEYPGAPNGRVRDVPDRRAIRWYTTTGLVDRPAGMRGRTALYGPRHLLQLVALKRRQAQGHTLAAIQAELAGAGDAELAAVARVPEDLLTGAGEPAADGPVRARFWATPAAAPPVAAAAATPSPTAAAPPAAAHPVGGVALGGGAILVLPVRPDAADYAAIATAARPLLDLLAARGLLAGDTLDDGSPS
ncbi:MerR family transcriptional regulator [Actinoplanes nipponensis]|uniref:MerR family transcriptional regulator n=1 Tax=Actinoplanes nipponensis TaxID=135950 RepID=UPI001EF3A38B|nr:MerR family transcriptional regulator [Actinoplanes nipponensis]